MTDAPPASESHLPRITELLRRPDEQRRREYQYRCAQTIVFGLPVLALHRWGASLGGTESRLWSGILQTLLTGWIIYVAAAGMLFEGILLLTKRRLTGDLIVASVATAVYLLSLVLLVGGVGTQRRDATRPPFYWCVLVMGAWSGGKWLVMSRRVAKAQVEL